MFCDVSYVIPYFTASFKLGEIFIAPPLLLSFNPADLPLPLTSLHPWGNPVLTGWVVLTSTFMLMQTHTDLQYIYCVILCI